VPFVSEILRAVYFALQEVNIQSAKDYQGHLGSLTDVS
jgi:hypothetical protein